MRAYIVTAYPTSVRVVGFPAARRLARWLARHGLVVSITRSKITGSKP